MYTACRPRHAGAEGGFHRCGSGRCPARRRRTPGRTRFILRGVYGVRAGIAAHRQRDCYHVPGGGTAAVRAAAVSTKVYSGSSALTAVGRAAAPPAEVPQSRSVFMGIVSSGSPSVLAVGGGGSVAQRLGLDLEERSRVTLNLPTSSRVRVRCPRCRAQLQHFSSWASGCSARPPAAPSAG